MTTRLQALAGAGVRLMVLAEIATAPVIRAFGGWGTYTSPDGRVWSGVGELGQISLVETKERVAARSFRLGLAVAGGQALAAGSYEAFATAIAQTTSAEIRGATVRAYFAVFDEEGQLIENTLTLWASGIGSRIIRTFSAEAIAVEIECVSRLDAVFPSRSLFLTDADQQGIWSGDRGLEYAYSLRAGGRIGRWSPIT